MTRRSRIVFTLATVGGLVFGLVGCAQEIDSATPPAGVSTQAEATAAPAPSPEVSTEAQEEEVVTAAPCMHGTWLADNAFFLASMQEFGDVFGEVSGRVMLTFSPDGSLVTDYQEWHMSGTNEGAAVTITRSGVDTGVFSIDGGNISIEDTSVGSLLVVTAGGFEMPVEPVPVAYRSATFTCDATSASITTPDGTMLLTRE